MPEKQQPSASYFDREFATRVVKILPGEFYATADGTAITTLLGSCVSVCLFDRFSGVGGMNHFMLPQVLQGSNTSRCSDPSATTCDAVCSARYGACAMRQLLQRLQALGASHSRLEAKLFGAARVMAGMSDIGEKNASFALGYLEEYGIPVVASDLGSTCPRKVVFFPASGRAVVKRIRELPAGTP
jgi:chemotaxis protein CheD